MRTVINAFLSQFDLDVRKSHDARFVDQKCTPDLVSFIADCVVTLAVNQPTFSVEDVWKSQYFEANMSWTFGKPCTQDNHAHNEYNKVLSQPLKLLAYAHILKVEKEKPRLLFSVENAELLEYIARYDRNAYHFLYCYFMKVMEDSGMMPYLTEYMQGKCDRKTVYHRYYLLINGCTDSHSQLDITRMFHKVFNVFAYEHGLSGSSGKPLSTADLKYNRTNWRDKNKAKAETRRDAAEHAAAEQADDGLNEYSIAKAIRTIKKIQGITSEVPDSLCHGRATQVHHIFPKSDFPEIADYLENLILLTATQHNTKAHPDNQTQRVDREYQGDCLLAKITTVERSVRQEGDKYYSKENLLYVIERGLGLTFPADIPFSELKKAVRAHYNNL